MYPRGNLHRFASATEYLFLLSDQVLSSQAEDLKRMQKPKFNWGESRGYPRAFGFVNYVGLTPMTYCRGTFLSTRLIFKNMSFILTKELPCGTVSLFGDVAVRGGSIYLNKTIQTMYVFALSSRWSFIDQLHDEARQDYILQFT